MNTRLPRWTRNLLLGGVAMWAVTGCVQYPDGTVAFLPPVPNVVVAGAPAYNYGWWGGGYYRPYYTGYGWRNYGYYNRPYWGGANVYVGGYRGNYYRGGGGYYRGNGGYYRGGGYYYRR